MLSRLSLRSRLVLGVIALALVGLAVANVATYTSLRSFLVQQTDRGLQQSQFKIEDELAVHGCGRDDGRPLPGASPGDYVEVRDAGGAVVCDRRMSSLGDPEGHGPLLPAEVDAQRASYFTVSARDGGSRYRVRASVEPSTGATVLLARSLGDVDATLRRLLWIELLVTAAVLAGLAALGMWVVRLGLRPLEAIGNTADSIAAGDLSQRVEHANPRTEVGRLGLALNSMLARIEAAFSAQAASEQKLRRFVADASHELRTPLAAVRAYAELFSRGARQRPDDLARSMRGISRESERMSLLVEDLLLLARLDEGRPLERKPVELEQVAAEAVETARMVEPSRPIDFDSRPSPIVGDRDRLRQILDNLLANVRSHTPPGAPVSVRVRPSHGNAVLEVTDSGPGLSPEESQRVFERFYRADDSRSRASGGVGLGLSIVAAVADAHDGAIAVESRPNEGATFRMTLPLAQHRGR